MLTVFNVAFFCREHVSPFTYDKVNAKRVIVIEARKLSKHPHLVTLPNVVKHKEYIASCTQQCVIDYFLIFFEGSCSVYGHTSLQSGSVR